MCVEMPQIGNSRRRQLFNTNGTRLYQSDNAEFRCKPGTNSTCSEAVDCNSAQLLIVGAFIIGHSDEEGGSHE